MCRRSAQLGLFLLALAGCNFSMDDDWTPRGPRDAAIDAAMGRDAGVDAGAPEQGIMLSWCRAVCAASDDQGECEDRVSCGGDAAVCLDEPRCDRCSVCRDQ